MVKNEPRSGPEDIRATRWASSPAPWPLVVARGHENLLAALRAILGESRAITVIPDRRHGGRLLPRADVSTTHSVVTPG